MKGYNGKFLRVNLTDGRISIEEPPEAIIDVTWEAGVYRGETPDRGPGRS